MRFTKTREMFIPKGARKVADKRSAAVAYVYERVGVAYALGFHGKAQKPDYHFRFKSDAARQAQVMKHFAETQARAVYATERADKRNAEGHSLVLGDVLRASWGYDQTNIDYYEVTKVVGKRMVEIREIAQEREDSQQWATGKCVPVPGKYISQPMRKAARENGVRIASYAWANKVAPKIVAGVKFYDASSFSTYA